MIKIMPSILSADFCRLGEEIKRVENAGALHFDVMDGHFVPNISFGFPVLKATRKATDAFLDVHLMISHPLDYAKRFVDAGADQRGGADHLQRGPVPVGGRHATASAAG